jgi:uncharacterized membrane protein YozB (DUF420 family)
VNWSDLPAINACLNGTSAALLGAGYYFIRRQNRVAHRNCMVSALVTSALFLAGYLFYHAHAGHTVFQEPLWFRPIYLALLLTHTLLAIVIVPLIFITVYLAQREQWALHQRVARWTWPLWMYVSVTGVAIYLLLYQIFPQR